MQFELKDAQGNALSGKTVNIVFNKENYTLTTDQNGKGYLTLNGEAAGKYEMEVKFAGDDTYNGCDAKETITITDDQANNPVQRSTSNASVTTNTNGSSSSNLVYDEIYMIWYDRDTGIIADGEWGGKNIWDYRGFMDDAYEHPEHYPELQ